MNRVMAEDQRNAQPALLHRNVLQLVSHRRRFNQRGTVEEGTDFAVLELAGQFFVRIRVQVRLPKLADLLRQRHPFQQIMYALRNRQRRVFINIQLAIFVQVDPAVVVKGSFRRRNGEGT